MTADTGTQVRLQPLTYVDDRDGVMVGRPDTGSYGVFPREGAELLRSLEAGGTLESGARRWHDQTGETLDVTDFLGILEDLGFVVGDDEVRAAPVRVRWRRLGRVLFAPPAFLLYAAVVAAGLAAMVIDPGVRPTYEHIFFTSNISFIPVVLALAQFPLLLVHEGFHALAGRRLGLPSTLGIGRRFYYLVAETRMDALYSVPRGQRYLPFLAGALVDAVGVGAFTVFAFAGRSWGWPAWVTGLALALAFSGALRILWECLFYLETDFYFVINTATGCTDLHGAARRRVRSWLAAVRLPVKSDDGEWSERDLAVSRWYAPLMVAGYGLSLGTLLVVGVPTAVRFWTTVVHRFDGTASFWGLVDTVVFVLLALAELGLLAYVTIRDLRRRRSLSTEGNSS
ncbi:hypothetical protein ACFLIM_14385 [Nonomuraea sp. M3C6]|uniref:Peptide zinc metalloprotease protein n=1 Tax=Nonomuraea marmarensis TaxID=3351344 RepID=A0ABW7AAK1_9ACTN